MNAAPDLLTSLEALAEPSRLRILRLVDREELTVGDLARCTGLSQSSVSRHLVPLRVAGFVTERGEGVRSFVRRADEAPAESRAVFEAVLASVRSPAFGNDDDLRALETLRAERDRDHEAVFDRLAGDWDAVREEILGGRPSASEIAALLVPRGMRIVDAGAGTGVLLPWLSAVAGPQGRVIAVERSAAMAARAKERVRDLGNVEVRRGRIEELPIENGWADAVLLSLSLGHVEDVVAALAGCVRAAAPGGRIVVADVERHDDAALVARLGAGFRGFEPDALLAAMTAAGLTDVRRVTFPESASRHDDTATQRNGGPRAARRRSIPNLIPLLCTGTAPEIRRGARGGKRRRSR